MCEMWKGNQTMSKIGNHHVEVQESGPYMFGWKSAERGEPCPVIEPGTMRNHTEFKVEVMGWQDYHDQEKAK
jgi:hypothetical protein